MNVEIIIKYGLRSESGELIIEPKYDRIFNFVCGCVLARVIQDNKLG